MEIEKKLGCADCNSKDIEIGVKEIKCHSCMGVFVNERSE